MKLRLKNFLFMLKSQEEASVFCTANVCTVLDNFQPFLKFNPSSGNRRKYQNLNISECFRQLPVTFDFPFQKWSRLVVFGFLRAS